MDRYTVMTSLLPFVLVFMLCINIFVELKSMIESKSITSHPYVLCIISIKCKLSWSSWMQIDVTI